MRASIMVDVETGRPVGRMAERRNEMKYIAYFLAPWGREKSAGNCRRAKPQEARRIRAIEKRAGQRLPEVYA